MRRRQIGTLVTDSMPRSAVQGHLFVLTSHAFINRSSHSPLPSLACGSSSQAIDLLCFQLQGLVIAGLSDLARPADQLSLAQSGSLAATGIIWSRYSLVIIPKNYGLFSVNLFVAFTSSAQLYRAYMFHRNQEKEMKASAEEDLKLAAAAAAPVTTDLVKA